MDKLQGIGNRQSILDVKVQCPACTWTGSVGDAVADIDGDGSLGCPKCGQCVVANGIAANERQSDIKELFQDAQNQATGRGTGRCPACGGIWQRGECIECGHTL